MTTKTKLSAIRAKCVELLAIAEKRTQGQWKRQSIYGTAILCENSKNNGNMVCDLPDSSPECDQFSPNADFIASCAGPAEAGWKATIAAIDMLSITVFETDDVCTDGGAGCQAVENAEKMAKEIIAAWEGIV